MPVDRSSLPPLPGKPDWYVEHAPNAVDPRDAWAAQQVAAQAMQVAPPVSVPADTTFLASTSPLEAPQFPTADTEPQHGKGRKRMRAFAGKLGL